MFYLFSGVVIQVFILKIVRAGKLSFSDIDFLSELGVLHHLTVSFCVLIFRYSEVLKNLFGPDLH